MEEALNNQPGKMTLSVHIRQSSAPADLIGRHMNRTATVTEMEATYGPKVHMEEWTPTYQSCL